MTNPYTVENNYKKPSFAESFAEGFFTTAADTVNKRKEEKDKLDLLLKAKLQEIDPEIELEKRKAAVKLQYEDERRKQTFDNLGKYMGNDGTANATMQDTPSASVDDIDTVFAAMQKATAAKAKAQAAGDEESAKYFDTQIDAHKQKMEYLKNKATMGNKPVTGAEGTNIVEAIGKEAEENLKNPVGNSAYMPEELQTPNYVKGNIDKEKGYIQKHQALAQAIAGVKKGQLDTSTPEVSSTIQNSTKDVIKYINVLTVDDPRITPEAKHTAAQKINSFVSELSPEEQNKIVADPNFKAVFTPDVVKAISDNLKSPTAKPTASEPKAPTTQPTAKPTGGFNTPEAARIKALYKAGKLSKVDAINQLNALSAGQ